MSYAETYTTIIAKRSTIITSFVLVWHWFDSRLIQTASGRRPDGSGRLLVGPGRRDLIPVVPSNSLTDVDGADVADAVVDIR